MKFRENERYRVNEGWIKCLYGPALTHGDSFRVLFALNTRVNAVVMKKGKYEIVVFDTSELHEGLLLKEDVS